MLENNFGMDPRETEQVTPIEPVQNSEPVQKAEPVQQSAGGSYYSPRSGMTPPVGGGFRSTPPTPNDDGGSNNGPEITVKKSHKGLRALAVFAGIAFLSYASIQCYQFATENESVRKFLGKDTSVSDDRISLHSEAESSSEAETTGTQQSSTAATDVNAVNTSWIDLAARENAMSIPDIVKKVTPATVGVASTFVYQGQNYSIWGFGQAQTYEEERGGTGTGIIMSKDGYIITNAHVIYDSSTQYHMGKAKSVQVVLNEDYYDGETTLDATIIAYDVAEDIAVLKVNTTQDLTVAEFGSSDDLQVGELVVAIGNPLGFDLFGSVTTGIVSALNREVTINDNTMRLIQTDTAINAGNSGGPLINSYGQVIGINSSKLSASYYDEASIEGLCFAIPISHAQQVINDLINYGYVTGKPMIGITGKDVTEEISAAYGLPVGVYVRDVEQGSAADLAGIRTGDIIIAINGETISTYEELNNAKEQFKAGDTITITATRGGQDMDFTLTLQEKKPDTSN